VDNQRIQPHQQAAIDAAIHGPLALLLGRLHS
jgi:hypothetical protein